MNAEDIKKAIKPSESPAGNISKGITKPAEKPISTEPMSYEDFKRMASNYAAIRKVLNDEGFLKKPMTPRQYARFESMTAIEAKIPEGQRELFHKLVDESEANG